MKKILIVLLSICLLTGCGKKKITVVDRSNENGIAQIDIKLVNVLSLEVNSEVNLYDLIEDDNGYEIVTEDYLLDTSSLGEQYITLKYIKDDDPKEIGFKVNVIDTIKPSIEFTKELVTSVGKPIDLLSTVKVTDNSKEEIYATVEGDYSFDNVQSYNLKYIAQDSSGNKTEESFVLIVKAFSISTTITPGSEQHYVPSTPSNGITPAPTKDSYLHSATRAYGVNYNFGYVKSTDDFIADSKQEIMNIMFTALNEGADKFSFTCNYSNCINDLKQIGDDGTLAFIEDYVHPYNTYTAYDYQYSGDYVTITGTKRYKNNDIIAIENRVNKFLRSMDASMSTKDKIKYVHDHIVNNTVFDVEGQSIEMFSAVGAIVNGTAVCEGYTHAMSIYLYRMGIPNYRVSVTGLHTWNLVYVDGKWMHLDVTWDDPVVETEDGSIVEDNLRYDFFLVDADTVKKEDKEGEHNFDKTIYQEA